MLTKDGMPAYRRLQSGSHVVSLYHILNGLFPVQYSIGWWCLLGESLFDIVFPKIEKRSFYFIENPAWISSDSNT